MPRCRRGIEIVDVEVAYQELSSSFPTPVKSKNQKNKKQQQHFARRNLTPVLRDITVSAEAGQRIGVIGRTGAGKSTLLLSLLGFAPCAKGRITIDGVPVSEIDRAVLSKIVGTLPQVPLVLKGWTVRKFIDPFNEFCAKTLAAAVEKVGLLSTVAHLPEGLETIILKEGYEDAPGAKRQVQRGSECTAVRSTEEVDSPTRWLSGTLVLLLPNGWTHFRISIAHVIPGSSSTPCRSVSRGSRRRAPC